MFRSTQRRALAVFALTTVSVAGVGIATADGPDVAATVGALRPAMPTVPSTPVRGDEPRSIGDLGATGQAATDADATDAVPDVAVPDTVVPRRPVVERDDRSAERSGTQMVASWYGPRFHGNLTANGETYDQWGLTAAHKTLPFGTRLAVTNPATGRSVEVRINDRGPFTPGRDIDLSRAAAEAIGLRGVASVRVAEI